jgi:hypothetical protein
MPHRQEVFDLVIQPYHLLFQQPFHLTTRRTTFISNFEDACEFGQRKSHSQSTPNQAKPINSFRRVQTVIAGGSPGHRQYLHPLVVPQRVGADAD